MPMDVGEVEDEVRWIELDEECGISPHPRFGGNSDCLQTPRFMATLARNGTAAPSIDATVSQSLQTTTTTLISTTDI